MFPGTNIGDDVDRYTWWPLVGHNDSCGEGLPIDEHQSTVDTLLSDLRAAGMPPEELERRLTAMLKAQAGS